jgi:hypothetical protein
VATDPRIANFDADAVRAGLRLAMQVGLPPETEDQPLFVMPTAVTGDGAHRLDSQGTPFNADYRPARTAAVGRRVPCAIEYADSEGEVATFGLVAPSRVILTLLDQDYKQIQGFAYCVIGGNKYHYSRTETPQGLVSVGVYVVHCISDDEG